MEAMDFKSYCSRRGVTFSENHRGEMTFISHLTFSDKFKGYEKEKATVDKCCNAIIDWLLERWKDDFNNVYTIHNFCGGMTGEYYVTVKETCKRKYIGTDIKEATEVRDYRKSIEDCINDFKLSFQH